MASFPEIKCSTYLEDKEVGLVQLYLVEDQILKKGHVGLSVSVHINIDDNDLIIKQKARTCPNNRKGQPFHI